MTNKTLLTLSEEAKRAIIKDVETGAAIVINIQSVNTGSSEIAVGTFLTGTKEQRENDLQHRAISVFTLAMSEMIQSHLNNGMATKAVKRAITSDPRLAGIFDPEMPEEILSAFDTSKTFDEALDKIKGLDLECSCGECKANREAESNQDMSDIEKGNVPVH